MQFALSLGRPLLKSLDRLYFLDQFSKRNPTEMQLIAFLSHASE